MVAFYDLPGRRHDCKSTCSASNADVRYSILREIVSRGNALVREVGAVDNAVREPDILEADREKIDHE